MLVLIQGYVGKKMTICHFRSIARQEAAQSQVLARRAAGVPDTGKHSKEYLFVAEGSAVMSIHA